MKCDAVVFWLAGPNNMDIPNKRALSNLSYDATPLRLQAMFYSFIKEVRLEKNPYFAT